MERLVELWYKIPRDREWWVDKISALLTGCATGCFTLIAFYVGTVVLACAVCFLVAKDLGEALGMGFAWGSSLAIITSSVGGSAFLAAYSRFRGT